MTAESDFDLMIVVPTRHSDESGDQVDKLAAEITRWTGYDTRPLEFADTAIVGRSGAPLKMDVVRGDSCDRISNWLIRRLVRTTLPAPDRATR